MTTLWYPGRPPFNTAELTQLLDACAATVRLLASSQDRTLLLRLQSICEDGLQTIHRESVECLGSDATLNQLTAFLNAVFISVQSLTRENRWLQLRDVADDIVDVRDRLRADLEQVQAPSRLAI